MEEFRPGKDGAVFRPEEIKTDDDLIGMKELRDFFLVSLQLLDRISDPHLFRHRALAFYHHQGDAVDEDHDIRPVRFFGTFYPELIDGKKLVFLRFVEINETNRLLLSPGADVLIQGNAGKQISVEGTVCFHQAFRLNMRHAPHRLVDAVFR